MGFSKMLELLQVKDKGCIILTNLGTFYIARGKDAVLLNRLLELKVNCLEAEICKVGFPIKSLEKYTKLIEEKQYSYIVYNFDNQNFKLKKIQEYKGKKLNEEKEERLNCYICKNTVKIYKKEDKYIQAVADLYEQEEIENKKLEEKKNNKKKRRIIWIKRRKKKINYY